MFYIFTVSIWVIWE